MRNYLGLLIFIGWTAFGSAEARSPGAEHTIRATVEGGVSGGELVREFNGRGNTQTLAFSVQGNWEIRWRIEGNEKFPALSHFQADLYDAATHRYLGVVAQHTGSGMGREHVGDGGRFFFKIRARNVDWSLEVVDVDEPWERLGLAPGDAEVMKFGILTGKDPAGESQS